MLFQHISRLLLTYRNSVTLAESPYFEDQAVLQDSFIDRMLMFIASIQNALKCD
jgi:hypothetical protein